MEGKAEPGRTGEEGKKKYEAEQITVLEGLSAVAAIPCCSKYSQELNREKT